MESMKKIIQIAANVALFAGLLAGCATPPSPYVSVENWVIRQNAVPAYFAAYDVIFLYPYIGRSADRLPSVPSDRASAAYLHDFTAFVTQEPFGKKVRVFAPIVHRTKDGEFAALTADEGNDGWLKTAAGASIRETIEAIRYYLTTYHQPGHPYILLGHAQGSLYLYEALREMSDEIRPEDGFVAAYLPDLPNAALRRIEEDFAKGAIRPVRGKLDTGVVAAWRVEDGPRDWRPSHGGARPGLINPLNWSAVKPAAAELCTGAYYYDCANTNILARKLVVPQFCRAVPDGSNGVLRVVVEARHDLPLTGEAIAPFLGNIVENAGARVYRYRCKRRWQGWATETDELPVEDDEERTEEVEP